MSKIKYYTIFDKKGQVYQKPMVFPTDVDAVRSIQYEMKNQDSFLVQWPEDYQLIFAGEFDTDAGQFATFNKLIAEVVALMPKELVIPVGTAPVKE